MACGFRSYDLVRLAVRLEFSFNELVELFSFPFCFLSITFAICAIVVIGICVVVGQLPAASIYVPAYDYPSHSLIPPVLLLYTVYRHNTALSTLTLVSEVMYTWRNTA